MITITFLCAPEKATFQVVLPDKRIRAHTVFATKWQDVPKAGAKIKIYLPMLQPEAILTDFYFKMLQGGKVTTLKLAKELRVEPLQLQMDFVFYPFPSKKTLTISKIVHFAVSPEVLSGSERCKAVFETSNFIYSVDLQYCDSGFVLRKPVVLDSFYQFRVSVRADSCFLLDASNCAFEEGAYYVSAVDIVAAKKYHVYLVIYTTKFEFLKFKNYVFDLDVVGDYCYRHKSGYALTLEGTSCLFGKYPFENQKCELKLVDGQARLDQSMLCRLDRDSIGVCKRPFFKFATNSLLATEAEFEGITGYQLGLIYFMDFRSKPMANFVLQPYRAYGVFAANELFLECALDFTGHFFTLLGTQREAVDASQRASYEYAFSELNNFYNEVVPENALLTQDEQIFYQVRYDVMSASGDQAYADGNSLGLPVSPIYKGVAVYSPNAIKHASDYAKAFHTQPLISHSTFNRDDYVDLNVEAFRDSDDVLPSPITSKNASEMTTTRKQIMTQEDRNSLARIGYKVPRQLLYTDEIMQYVERNSSKQQIDDALKKAKLEKELKGCSNKFLSRDLYVAMRNIHKATLLRQTEHAPQGTVRRTYCDSNPRVLARMYQ